MAGPITSLVVADDYTYAVSGGSVYLLEGGIWSKCGQPAGGPVTSVTVHDKVVWIGCQNGQVYYSNDRGMIWNPDGAPIGF